jgi:DNA repair protein RecN (Recombination protein N)
MISTLTVQNFGLIDRLEISPGEGLNVFTGETGAGKSILIDALRFALGEKIKSSQVRDADRPCVVEAVFLLSHEPHPVLKEHLDEENALIIKRTYTPGGRTTNRVNGFTVTTAELRAIGDNLVDLHGPHDHQMLFSEDSHIKILDRLSGVEKEKRGYAEAFESFRMLSEQLDELNELAASRERELETLTMRIRELEQVSLENADYEKLLEQSSRAENLEKLTEQVSGLIELLDNEENGINTATGKAFSLMSALNRLDPGTGHLEEPLTSIQDSGNRLSSELNGYLENLSCDPLEMEKTTETVDIYNDLLRKYGPELDDVRSYYLSARERFDLLTDLEHNTESLKKDLSGARRKASKIAKELSTERKKAAVNLKDTIEKELKELGISKVCFECRVEKKDLSADGTDRVAFYISPNQGETLKPLADIASSGEAARVMLALKKALTRVDPIPVLIFDEIDAQIGGRLGTVTGKKLKELSKDRQVLLITHLPQIASFGDLHFKVRKQVKDSRTRTEVYAISEKDRIGELAEMMSGDDRNSIAVRHAEEMLSEAS